MGDPSETASERQHERAEHVENIIDETVQGLEYPTNPSEMKAAYSDRVSELPNETETLGDVFDRLAPDEYDTPQDAREAVLGELTGEAGEERGDANEYNPERELDAMEEAERED
ncbi:hypothetical protein GCM10009037_19210 [Halarchaeum grantii]|uniref:DUF2795 domain-containing protein n=1 Tax=Halarchaeum grantii TaxID=1193105 RepID=A0A830FAK9_9EURY|nr:hypothetical protein [Halarchaeum grantii]GGL35740.1 hypothetical protein GCM10009037_19210 [Halarchaeum grantii]